MEGRLGVRKGAWSEEEDNLLRKCVEKYGETKWYQVPERAGLNRCRKSCRLRWLNYLKPNIKRGEFTADEVDLIFRLHKLLGNRWSLIAGRLPGRTANDVKNYWNTHLRKKLDSSCDKNVKAKAHERTEKFSIIRPRPHTFSKNSLWLRAQTTTLNNEQPATHNICQLSTPFDQHQQENAETKWWESLLAEKEFDQEISSSMGWPEDGNIADLLAEKSPSGSGTKLEDSFVEAGQNSATADFSFDVELWDPLNTGQRV